MTVEQIAADYELPVDAVREAIAYCESPHSELLEDYARQSVLMEAKGLNDPNYNGKPRRLNSKERARLSQQ